MQSGTKMIFQQEVLNLICSQTNCIWKGNLKCEMLFCGNYVLCSKVAAFIDTLTKKDYRFDEALNTMYNAVMKEYKPEFLKMTLDIPNYVTGGKLIIIKENCDRKLLE